MKNLFYCYEKLIKKRLFQIEMGSYNFLHTKLKFKIHISMFIVSVLLILQLILAEYFSTLEISIILLLI